MTAKTKTRAKAETKTKAEARTGKKKSERTGEVRCNNCFARFWPAPGAEKAACPACGWEWYISWSGDLAKIRKPVWESWERLLAESQRNK